jgi:RNA polymerase sigma-70 factor (ECF subfamily)
LRELRVRVITLFGVSEKELVRLAIAGDKSAKKALVCGLANTLKHRIVRCLYRWGAARDPWCLSQVEDWVQETWLRVFSDDSRLLREWDEGRAPLPIYLGIVAERRAAEALRARRRRQTSLEAPEEIEAHADDRVDLEKTLEDRELFARLEIEIIAECSERDVRLYRSLLLEEEPVDRVCAREAMSREALYAWKTRFLRRARKLLSISS